MKIVVKSVNHPHEDGADRRDEGQDRGRQTHPGDPAARRNRFLHPGNTSSSNALRTAAPFIRAASSSNNAMLSRAASNAAFKLCCASPFACSDQAVLIRPSAASNSLSNFCCWAAFCSRSSLCDTLSARKLASRRLKPELELERRGEPTGSPCPRAGIPHLRGSPQRKAILIFSGVMGWMLLALSSHVKSPQSVVQAARPKGAPLGPRKRTKIEELAERKLRFDKPSSTSRCALQRSILAV
jgi:hypothetical protein